MLLPDERMRFEGESKWLLKIISEVSKKDMGQFAWLYFGHLRKWRFGPAGSIRGSNFHGHERCAAKSLSQDSVQATDNSEWSHRSLILSLSRCGQESLSDIFCEELRALDGQLPVVADTEDSLGTLPYRHAKARVGDRSFFVKASEFAKPILNFMRKFCKHAYSLLIA